MLGLWIRPWPGERVVAQIVAVSGDMLECRSPGGAQFQVEMVDVRSGRLKLFASVSLNEHDDVPIRRLPGAFPGVIPQVASA